MICFLAIVVFPLVCLNQQIYHPGAVVALRLVIQKSTSMISIMNGNATFFFVVGDCHQAQTVVQLL